MLTARLLSLKTNFFVTGDENSYVCSKNISKIFSLKTIFNIEHARNGLSSLTTKDKIFVASDNNCVVCARLYKDEVIKADFHSRISGARDFLRLIVDLGMRTYNRKARESDRAIAKKSSSVFDFF